MREAPRVPVEEWTDDEWLAVIRTVPPDANVAVGEAAVAEMGPKERDPMTTFDAPDTAVVIQQCWGCNRLRAPKPWASKPMIDLLRSEGRLRIEEYLCGNANCPANVMAGITRAGSALTKGGR